MALKIKKASDKIECTTIKALIYGEPGIGKTTLSLTAPSPLLIDCDAGIRRVSPNFRRDYIDVYSWADINDLLNSPDEIGNYETLVIDTVGKLLEFMSVKIISENHKMGSKTGGLTLQGYGALLGEFRAFNTRLMQLNKNVIYLAHDKEVSDGDKIKLRPDITGRSMGSILREMDLVGYMQSRNGDRTISFSPSDLYYGKNTCNLPAVINISDLNKVKYNPMSDIFNDFKKMIASQQEVMNQYMLLLQDVDNKLNTINNAEDATKVSEEFKLLPEIWDSKLIARLRFHEKINEIGVKFDKDKKVFVDPEKQNKDENEPEGKQKKNEKSKN